MHNSLVKHVDKDDKMIKISSLFDKKMSQLTTVGDVVGVRRISHEGLVPQAWTRGGISTLSVHNW